MSELDQSIPVEAALVAASTEPIAEAKPVRRRTPRAGARLPRRLPPSKRVCRGRRGGRKPAKPARRTTRSRKAAADPDAAASAAAASEDASAPKPRRTRKTAAKAEPVADAAVESSDENGATPAPRRPPSPAARVRTRPPRHPPTRRAAVESASEASGDDAGRSLVARSATPPLARTTARTIVKTISAPPKTIAARKNARNDRNGKQNDRRQGNRNDRNDNHRRQRRQHDNRANREIAPSVTLEELGEMKVAELRARAAELAFDATGLKKAELVEAVYAATLKAEGFIEVSGVLDVLADGYGFCARLAICRREATCTWGPPSSAATACARATSSSGRPVPRARTRSSPPSKRSSR